MAQKIVLKRPDGTFQESYIGFSWTCLFFGFCVPLLRKDYLHALICLILSAPGWALGPLIYAFIYNKMFTKNLIEKNGYRIEGTEVEVALLKQKLGVYYA